MAGNEFVEGWIVAQVLGEGAYGEVRLLVNRYNGESVALKTMRAMGPDAALAARKEAALHRALRHPNVLRCLGSRQQDLMHYMFLEYCEGGELFDRIEPDIGMMADKAQRYFTQLLSGVGYLHSQGIAHRDIKPENILLDGGDNVKISDFGMATVFRYKGTERLLNKRCGTLPYVGPEVLLGPYKAEPADLWSCGIVLLTMLAGELPWDQPSLQCQEFVDWGTGMTYATMKPWSKLEPTSLSMLRKLLSPEPEKRPLLLELLAHRWLARPVSNFGETNYIAEHSRMSLSQPLPGIVSSNPWDQTDGCGLSEPSMDMLISFSQPTDTDDLLLGSQYNYTQQQCSQTQNVFQKLVKRMTRFFVKLDLNSSMDHLCKVLEKLNYQWKYSQQRVITISTIDRFTTALVFKATFIEMDNRILLDFRLSKGCGLEFKRRFLQIKQALVDIIAKTSGDWPLP